jgi:hypothetical protein
METKFVKVSTPSGKQPEQPLKMHSICTNLHQIFITNAKKMQLELCIVYTQEANSGNAEPHHRALTANRLRDSI